MNKLNLILLSFSLVFCGCYPEEEVVTKSGTDIVVTFKNKDANFSNYKTFAVSDVLYDPNYQGYSGWYNLALIDQIEKNMEALSYTLETNPSTNTPDLVIIPEIIFTNNYIVGDNGCYYGCWGWGGCLDCWWGGYPPYYPPSYVVTYSSGSILIHMIDPKIAVNNQEVNILWKGAIDGLLRNDLSANFLNNYVDQAFTQSADYLTKP